MSHRLSLLDRLVVGVVAVLALGAGAWALLWALEHPLGAQLAGLADLGAIDSLMASSWYPLLLVVIVALTGFVGLWLLGANLKRNSFNLLAAGESSDIGQLSLSTTQMARATAAQIARHSDVTSTETSTRLDRGEHVVTITVFATPEVRLRSLLNAIEEADSDFRDATPGLDVRTRFLLKLNPVAAS